MDQEVGVNADEDNADDGLGLPARVEWSSTTFLILVIIIVFFLKTSLH